MSLWQNYGKKEVRRRKERNTYWFEDNTLSVRNSGRSVGGTPSLVFTDGVTNRSGRMNCKVYRALLKKTRSIRQWPSYSPDLSPTEQLFSYWRQKLNAERPTNKQQLKAAPVKAWHLKRGNTAFSDVQGCKGFSFKYLEHSLLLKSC